LVCRADDTAGAATYGAGMNLAVAMTATAERRGARPALRQGDATLSYRRLERSAARLAALLERRGVEVGDPVLVLLPDVLELGIVYQGVLRAGAVLVLVEADADEATVVDGLRRSRARLICAWHGRAESAEAAAAAVGADCLFVTPGELDRLLARVAPSSSVRDRAGSDPAVMLPSADGAGAIITHDELAREAAALARDDAAPACRDLRGRVGALTAAAMTGACLVLPLAGG
jgi:long-chain acyl-CoA synthetase